MQVEKYNIKDLEKITGIKAHTIRIWEKRYSIIEPQRTDTNIRYYSGEDLRKLLNISVLNRHGFKISKLASLSYDELKEKVLDISDEQNDHESIIDKLTVNMLELNEISFVKNINDAIRDHGFENTVTYILYPFFDKIGLLWLIGSIHPAHEHFISNLIRQKIISAIDKLPFEYKSDYKTFLLFLPENELHEIGLLFYNYLVRKNGHKVIYLGQSVPYNDLLEVKKLHDIDILITSYITNIEEKDITSYLQKLSSSFSNQKILINGYQIINYKKQLPDNFIRLDNAITLKDYISKL
jgi:DNA-binding transcriptional MerR regulator